MHLCFKHGLSTADAIELLAAQAFSSTENIFQAPRNFPRSYSSLYSSFCSSRSFFTQFFHFLSGDHCEKCSDGWYGNATNGTPEDCSPCPCPGGPNAVNQFARTCVLSNDGLPTCENCSAGHEGRYCERCMDGYFGRPRVSRTTHGLIVWISVYLDSVMLNDFQSCTQMPLGDQLTRLPFLLPLNCV